MSSASAAPVKREALDIEGNPLRVGSSVYMLSTRRHYEVVGMIGSDELGLSLPAPVWYPVLSSIDPNDPELLDSIPVRPKRLMRTHY